MHPAIAAGTGEFWTHVTAVVPVLVVKRRRGWVDEVVGEMVKRSL